MLMSRSQNNEFYKYIQELKHDYPINNRILLINLPLFDLSNVDLNIAQNKGYYAYPPTGLLFLATTLKTNNVNVQICDLNFEILKKTIEKNQYSENYWQEILEARLAEFQPAFIGITCMFSHYKYVYEKIIRYIVDKNQYLIITGGTQVSFEYNEILLKKLGHFAITKDSEEKLPFLMNCFLCDHQSFEPLGGIYFMYEGRLSSTEGEESQPEIDYNINESYDLIPIEEYFKVGSLNQFSRIYGDTIPFSALSMNRGCRGHCAFCSVRSLLGKNIRSRSIDNIISEIEFLVNHKGITQFDILDDDFLANISNCKSLLREIIKRQLQIKWYVNNGVIAGSIDEELLQLMLDSGCVGFKIGIESGNASMLKKIRKPATLTNLLSKSLLFNKYPDLIIAGNYIIGFPQETFSQMLDTFIFANRMNIDWAGFYICQPIKGADVFNSFEELCDERCEDKPQNYMPSRELEQNKTNNEKSALFEGTDILCINKSDVVNEEQLKEIWFVFGFITNFINNKNLRPEGHINKFIDWVKVALMAYPSDAGMMLFLYFAYVVAGDLVSARDYFDKCRTIVEESVYWENRFIQFGLSDAQNNFITDKEMIFDLMEGIVADICDKYDMEI